jgi:hypothetical protein
MSQGTRRRCIAESDAGHQEETERVRYRVEWVTRTLQRKRHVPDNDLPGIVAAYRAFRAEPPEPGQGLTVATSHAG